MFSFQEQDTIKMAKDNTRRNGTMKGGILFGFALGFSSSLFISLSIFQSMMFKEGLEESLHGIPETSHSITKPKKNNAGWKDIHVFYGDKSHLPDASDIKAPYFKANKWFSQYRQDEIVSRLFHGKRGGYFIDLAANDAVRISNTYALETSLDWNGLCIEPNPVYWTALSYRKCHVVAAIVGNKTMEEVSFLFSRGKPPKGGIVGNQFDNKQDKYDEARPRFTVSLLDVFQKFQVPKTIDYISLDVEGAEDLVLSAFPFNLYRFNVMTVERPNEKLSSILAANGYLKLKTLSKNTQETLWAHDSVLGDLDKSALDINSENYKYTEKIIRERIAPEEATS